MDSQADKKANLAKAGELVREAAGAGASLVGLPEFFNFMGPEEDEPVAAEDIPGPSSAFLAELAQETGVWLHGGSILEKTPDPQKPANTSLCFGPDGGLMARYRKVHLFDVAMADGPSILESNHRTPGQELCLWETPMGKIGLSICYDMRFPEMYRIMVLRGAVMFMVPAAYTMFTGRDHWQPVLRARAIENQAYLLAPAQIGVKPAFQTNGRALVIDPWGTVIAQAPDCECVVMAELDTGRIEQVRSQVPSLKNRRPMVYDWPR